MYCTHARYHSHPVTKEGWMDKVERAEGAPDRVAGSLKVKDRLSLEP
jgi:hypothetical protein